MRNKLSQTQRMALFWAGGLAPAAEHLPRQLADLAGTGSWLAPLLAALPLLLLLSLLSALAGERGLAASLSSVLGRKAGRGVLALYLLWGLGLLALRFRLCAQRLVDSGTRDGNLWFFLLVTAALVLWMGRGTLGAFARAGQLFLALLLTAVAVVLLLSLRPADLLRLTPAALAPKPLLAGTLTTAGRLGAGTPSSGPWAAAVCWLWARRCSWAVWAWVWSPGWTGPSLPSPSRSASRGPSSGWRAPPPPCGPWLTCAWPGCWSLRFDIL